MMTVSKKSLGVHRGWILGMSDAEIAQLHDDAGVASP